MDLAVLPLDVLKEIFIPSEELDQEAIEGFALKARRRTVLLLRLVCKKYGITVLSI
jgi:hypothetical protein